MNAALLVGVNKYAMPGNDLRGCINDVENMRSLLTEHCGYSMLQVRSLTDTQATKQRIMAGLTQMVAQANKGDHLVFHFSGHGSQVPDTEGDELDRLDEILCPHDFDWNGAYIKDDDLRRVVEALHPGATLDVILDACHSGTGLRDVDALARFIPYPGPEPFNCPILYVKRIQTHDLPNVALWAGCESNQTSADAFIGGKAQGAMTWAFVKAVRYDGLGKRTRPRILVKVDSFLNTAGYDQRPQLEASDEMRGREIFT